MKKETPAQSEYEAAVERLRKFCEDHTDLTPVIMDDKYPIRVQFIPDAQMSIFGDENVDENGEVNDLTVSVGLTTAVKSTLKFKMDSKLLKKLIKHAETVGTLYYQAYREEHGERTTPRRPHLLNIGDDNILCCPSCDSPVDMFARSDLTRAFCFECGQALNLATVHAQESDEDVLERLRDLCDRKEAPTC